MLRREVNTPPQVMFPSVKQQVEDHGEYVSSLLEGMKKAHEAARSTLQTSQRRMKRDFDLRVLLRPYTEGDVVYLLDKAVSMGKSRRLTSPWKGPAIIVKKLSAYLYRVKLRNEMFVTNHDRMMPCNDRKLPDWIVKYKKYPTLPETDEDNDEAEYCFCKKPYHGRFMIQCDFCDKWYHGSCVNITATDALDINKYRGRDCKE